MDHFSTPIVEADIGDRENRLGHCAASRGLDPRTIEAIAAGKQTKTIANPIASINRFAVAHVVPSSCTGETTRAITGIVKTSSHMTVVAVRDENTATLQGTSDAPINAAHVPGVIDTHAPPRFAATSSRPTDIQQTM